MSLFRLPYYRYFYFSYPGFHRRKSRKAEVTDVSGQEKQVKVFSRETGKMD